MNIYPKDTDNTLVYLRSLEMQDFEQIYYWHTDRDLYQSLGGVYHYVSREAEREWLTERLKYSIQEVNLAICLKEDKHHIGNIYLRNIDWVSRNAELHLFIGDKDLRGKGYGTDAVKLLIEHAFYDLGLLRIYLYVLESNRRAIKVYENCGFVNEGKLRKHALKNGELENVIIMGIIQDDIKAAGDLIS